jgi:hypothetical protein
MTPGARYGIDKRRDPRHPFRTRIVLSKDGRDMEGYTENAGITGLFARFDRLVPERWLVNLRLALPPEGEELAVMGMVTRQVPARDGLLPGLGILLYALQPAARKRWNRFIESLEAGPPALAVPAERHDPRFPVSLQVRLHSMDDVQMMYTRNVSRGGLFVGTALNIAEGTATRVSVIHPRTREHFVLDAVVRWRRAAPDPGIGLEFVGLTDQRRAEFLGFVRSEIPIEEVDYVSEDQRHLGPATGRSSHDR